MTASAPVWLCLEPLAVCTLHWRHNDHDGVSNHQPRGCLLNRLFRRRAKKTSKLRVTGLFAGNSPGQVNSPHKGPVTRKCFHLMTSSWLCYASMQFPVWQTHLWGLVTEYAHDTCYALIDAMALHLWALIAFYQLRLTNIGIYLTILPQESLYIGISFETNIFSQCNVSTFRLTVISKCWVMIKNWTSRDQLYSALI